jgi:hypothetical protein
MYMIDVLKGLWMKFKKKSEGVYVRKLDDDEVAFLEQLVARDAQVYEIATALELSDTRTRYEVKKIKDRDERIRETTTRD